MEDIFDTEFGADLDDESDLTCNIVIDEILGNPHEGVSNKESSGLFLNTQADNINSNTLMLEDDSSERVLTTMVEKGNTFGPGKRKRKPNTLYHDFWHRHDEDASDVE
ncbi:hypothetical protein BDQ17DRAFT_1425622 [Cyathus striatus]|nr:hypothetical protein BDQ17DRAFT_1425622 [Cyathus striatus]